MKLVTLTSATRYVKKTERSFSLRVNIFWRTLSVIWLSYSPPTIVLFSPLNVPTATPAVRALFEVFYEDITMEHRTPASSATPDSVAKLHSALTNVDRSGDKQDNAAEKQHLSDSSDPKAQSSPEAVAAQKTSQAQDALNFQHLGYLPPLLISATEHGALGSVGANSAGKARGDQDNCGDTQAAAAAAKGPQPASGENVGILGKALGGASKLEAGKGESAAERAGGAVATGVAAGAHEGGAKAVGVLGAIDAGAKAGSVLDGAAAGVKSGGIAAAAEAISKNTNGGSNTASDAMARGAAVAAGAAAGEIGAAAAAKLGAAAEAAGDKAKSNDKSENAKPTGGCADSQDKSPLAKPVSQAEHAVQGGAQPLATDRGEIHNAGRAPAPPEVKAQPVKDK
jgi:hypothetical protein